VNNKETTVNRNIDGETAEGHVHFRTVQEATEVGEDATVAKAGHRQIEDAETEGHIRVQ
jgi:hypothetical protein